MVSNAFTLLVLSPLLLLLVCWLRLGVNVANFPVSLSGLGEWCGVWYKESLSGYLCPRIVNIILYNYVGKL